MFLTGWKADLSDKIKQEFFSAVAMSVLLYGCTISANETLGESARPELHKYATSSFK